MLMIFCQRTSSANISRETAADTSHGGGSHGVSIELRHARQAESQQAAISSNEAPVPGSRVRRIDFRSEFL